MMMVPHPKPPLADIPQNRRRWTIGTPSESIQNFVRRLTGRRRPLRQRQPSQPRDCRTNGALPQGHESRQTVNLQSTTSSGSVLPPNVVVAATEQHACSTVDNLPRPAESDTKTLQVIAIDKRAITIPNSAKGIQQRTDAKGAVGRKRPPMFESQSSPSTSDLGAEEGDASRRGPGKLWSAKRTNSKAGRGVQSPGNAPPGVPSLGRDDSSRSMPVERGDKDPSTRTHPPGGDKRKSANPKKVEQSATSSDSEEIKKLRRDLATSQSQIAELQKRCEAQSRDAEGMNFFLNTADKCSDSDVIQALQRLNSQVQHSTTYMAECLVEDFEFQNVTKNPTNEQVSAMQRASKSIGQVLAQSLGTRIPEDIPMLLETAFQGYLTSILCQTASSWVVEPGPNTIINDIYQSLCKKGLGSDSVRSLSVADGRKTIFTEAQSISGHWRSLTRRHVVAPTCTTAPNKLVTEIVDGLSDLVVAAGCTASQSDIMSKVSSKFEKNILSLVLLAGRLNKMFDEVISSDFEVFVVRPGEKFESKRMEDMDGGRDGIQNAPVLCATHLGLLKQVPMGTLWERGQKQKMMVLKAKVLLESFLTKED